MYEARGMIFLASPIFIPKPQETPRKDPKVRPRNPKTRETSSTPEVGYRVNDKMLKSSIVRKVAKERHLS